MSNSCDSIPVSRRTLIGMRPFQLVVFGASGFTGQRIVENLVQFLKCSPATKLSWAVAGRSPDKVRRVLDQVSHRTGIDVTRAQIMTASLEDNSSLVKMASAADIVMNCTGPFRLTGDPVVSACIEASTNYLDIAGEPQFMEQTQLKWHKAARDRNIFVIPGSGTDCIPCDCGVNYLRDNFNGKLNAVQIFLASNSKKTMTANVTTWYSLVDGLGDVKSLINIRKQLFRDVLLGAPSRPKFDHPLRPLPAFSKYSDSKHSGFAIPFKGADPSVVKRSQAHNQIVYKEDPVDTKIYQLISLRGTLSYAWLALWVSLLAKSNAGRRILKKFPEFFSGGIMSQKGPSEEELREHKTTFTLAGQGWRTGSDETKAPTYWETLRLTGPHGGYPFCAIVVNQAAMTMLEERDRLPAGGGVYTPGTAFRRTTIIDRLGRNGIDVSIEKS